MCTCNAKIDRLVKFVEDNFEKSRCQNNLIFQKLSDLENRVFQKVKDLEGYVEKKIFDAQAPMAKFPKIDLESVVKKEIEENNKIEALGRRFENFKSKFDTKLKEMDFNINAIRVDHGKRLSELETSADKLTKNIISIEEKVKKQIKIEQIEMVKNRDEPRINRPRGRARGQKLGDRARGSALDVNPG